MYGPWTIFQCPRFMTMLLLKDSHQKVKRPIGIEAPMQATVPLPRRKKNERVEGKILRPVHQTETESVLKELADFIESEGGVLTP